MTSKRTIKRTMLRDDVYDTLLEMLLTDEFRPGSSLSIDSVARQLGVSPTPVREALVELETTGLVTRAALKGYTVAEPLTDEQMVDLLDARMVLELAVTERAAARSSEVLKLLRAAHKEHEKVARGLGLTDPERTVQLDQTEILEYFRADWAFHEVLIEGSGNPFLEQMSSALGSNVHRTRQSLGQGVWDAPDALREHAQIVTAFEAGDVEGAVAAMREHLEAVGRRAQIDIEAEIAAK